MDRLVQSRPSALARALPLSFVFLMSAVAWAVVFTTVPPDRQDFPFGDDWAFARGAFQFARDGTVDYHGWSSVPLLGQWLWAWPFIRTLGEHHYALRASTIVLGWLAIAAFYELMRQERVPRGRSAFAAAALAFFPLFFVLQSTYMTDVPALAFGLSSLALYGRALISGRYRVWLGATIVATLGALTRQTALVVPLVGAVMLWERPSLKRRPLWNLALLVPLAAGVAAHVWLERRPDVWHREAWAPTTPVVVLTIFLLFHFGGLAAVPLILADPRPSMPRVSVIAGLLLLAVACYWWTNYLFLPYSFRGLFPYVIGAITAHGAGSTATSVGDRAQLMSDEVRLAVTAIGCIGGAIVAGRLVERLWWGRGLGPVVLYAVAQVPFMLLVPQGGLFDRYYLPVIPAALALAASPEECRPLRMWRWAVGFLALGAVAAFSVAFTHDWLSWASARWQLGEQAVHERHIDPSAIEGGLEWDGWNSPDRRHRRNDSQPARLTLPSTRVLFPQVTGEYALSFSELPETVTIAEQPYVQWLLPGNHHFYLLRDEPPP
jgi:4-amino-4-deoxy-L-arabinose transferase-like glycosyltransferase